MREDLIGIDSYSECLWFCKRRGRYKRLVFVFKQKTAYEVRLSLVGSEMYIRDRSYSIPDIVTAGAPIVWVLAALTTAITAWTVPATLRRITQPPWARLPFIHI